MDEKGGGDGKCRRGVIGGEGRVGAGADQQMGNAGIIRSKPMNEEENMRVDCETSVPIANAAPARKVASGPAMFQSTLATTLERSADISCHEPQLSVDLDYADDVGEVTLRCKLRYAP